MRLSSEPVGWLILQPGAFEIGFGGFSFSFFPASDMASCGSFSHCHSCSLTRCVQSPRRAHVVRASVGTSYPVDVSTAVDHGRVLGVRPNASKVEVKAAFRKLALRYHPDVCKDDECVVDFMEVNRAYESLMAVSSLGDQSQQCDAHKAADSAQEGDVFFHREDYSSYYSNLKYYSKAGRNRRYAGAYQYF